MGKEFWALQSQTPKRGVLLPQVVVRGGVKGALAVVRLVWVVFLVRLYSPPPWSGGIPIISTAPHGLGSMNVMAAASILPSAFCTGSFDQFVCLLLRLSASLLLVGPGGAVGTGLAWVRRVVVETESWLSGSEPSAGAHRLHCWVAGALVHICLSALHLLKLWCRPLTADYPS